MTWSRAAGLALASVLSLSCSSGGRGSGTGPGPGPGPIGGPNTSNDGGSHVVGDDASVPDAKVPDNTFMGCASAQYEAKYAPAAMMVALDTSGTMASRNKYAYAQQAIVAAIDQRAFDTVALGLLGFPTSDTSAPECLFGLVPSVRCGVSGVRAPRPWNRPSQRACGRYSGGSKNASTSIRAMLASGATENNSTASRVRTTRRSTHAAPTSVSPRQATCAVTSRGSQRVRARASTAFTSAGERANVRDSKRARGNARWSAASSEPVSAAAGRAPSGK